MVIEAESEDAARKILGEIGTYEVPTIVSVTELVEA